MEETPPKHQNWTWRRTENSLRKNDNIIMDMISKWKNGRDSHLRGDKKRNRILTNFWIKKKKSTSDSGLFQLLRSENRGPYVYTVQQYIKLGIGSPKDLFPFYEKYSSGSWKPLIGENMEQKSQKSTKWKRRLKNMNMRIVNASDWGWLSSRFLIVSCSLQLLVFEYLIWVNVCCTPVIL